MPYEQKKLFPLLPNLNLRLRVGDSLVQEVGGISLHVRDSKLSQNLKRKLTALKSEKEKYYNNDPTTKFKTDKSLLQKELRIFGEILDDKIVTLQKEIQTLEIKNLFHQFASRKTESIYTELGLNPSRPIREQTPEPLPDRKALDDIVFDILGLTEDERNEVYWSVCELVKNRLEKARSV
jgi:hypothetical protein